MPRTKRPLRQRPTTLKEMDESLAAWNPALDAYNKRLRELDTPEEKLLQQQGRETYAARLAKRRKELKVAAALPPCPVTEEKPNREISGFSLSHAVARIPGMPRIDRAVLRVLADHYSPQRKVVWPAVETIAELVPCSDRSVQDSLNRLEAAGYIAVQTGSDRKGDSRLRPDKPRAGGRAKTTRWRLNGNGIFRLAYPETGMLEKGEVVSPFEPVEIEKGEATTVKGEATTVKGEVVAPEQSIYPSSEPTTTTTRAAEGRGRGNSSKPKPSAIPFAAENQETLDQANEELPVNGQETRNAAAYLSKRFVEVTGRTLKLTKEHRKTLGTLARDYDVEIVQGVWNEYLSRAPWNADTQWHAADFLQNFDSYFAHAQESATKALRPFLDKDGKPKTDAKLCAEAAWALSLHKKRWSVHASVVKERPETYAPTRSRPEQEVVDAYIAWRVPGGKFANDFRFADTPLRDYRTVLAISKREWDAGIRCAEETMRNDIAEYLAASNPSDALIRSAHQSAHYFDDKCGLTGNQRRELDERCDRLPPIAEEEDEDGNEE